MGGGGFGGETQGSDCHGLCGDNGTDFIISSGCGGGRSGNFARAAQNRWDGGSSFEPSIYCSVRVSGIFSVGESLFLERFLGVLANGLWTRCAVWGVQWMGPHSLGKLIEWKLIPSLS